MLNHMPSSVDLSYGSKCLDYCRRASGSLKSREPSDTVAATADTDDGLLISKPEGLALTWGGGYISLEDLIFFARNFPDSFQLLLHKQVGMRSEWEYPFDVAGVNISFMLVQMLDLQSGVEE